MLRRLPGGPIVLFVGAARYYKGVHVLLRAMARVQGRLIVAGRGTQNLSLTRLAGDMGIDARVNFCGEVSQSRLRILLNAEDVFVLFSINCCETFSIYQLEAMACSKPVVSTDLPAGVRSVPRHGTIGFVMCEGDSKAYFERFPPLWSFQSKGRTLGKATNDSFELLIECLNAVYFHHVGSNSRFQIPDSRFHSRI